MFCKEDRSTSLCSSCCTIQRQHVGHHTSFFSCLIEKKDVTAALTLRPGIVGCLFEICGRPEERFFSVKKKERTNASMLTCPLSALFSGKGKPALENNRNIERYALDNIERKKNIDFKRGRGLAVVNNYIVKRNPKNAHVLASRWRKDKKRELHFVVDLVART